MVSSVSQIELIDGLDQVVSLDLIEDQLGEIILLEGRTTELIALEAPSAQISIGPTLSEATPLSVDSSGAAGSANAAARADHVHPHGNLSGGLLHTLASTEAAGFLSPNEKRRLLELASGSDQQLLIADSSSLETFRYGKLFDTNVASDAAIAGTKINPNFGTQNLATTGNLAASNAVISGNLTVSGTLTTVNTENIQVTDKTIVLSNITPAADATANEGGIILKGATDKTILWLSGSGSWTFNQSVDLVSGKTFNINNQTVLTATTLGSSVTASSLTSVGTITSGSWDEGIY